MKVYTRVVYDIDGNVIEADWYDYDGPVEECKKGGSSGGTSSTTTSYKPNKYQKTGYEEAERLWKKGESTIAPYSAATQDYIDRLKDRGYGTGPDFSDLSSYYSDIRGGKYLDPKNDAYMSNLDYVTRSVVPGVTSQFVGAGRTGRSGVAAQALGEGLSLGMTPYLNEERNRMDLAAAAEAGLRGLTEDYENQRLGLLGQAGALDDAMASALAGEDQARLDRYLAQVGGLPGSSTMLTNQPVYGGKGGATGALGGAATTGSLLGTMGYASSPWAWPAIGAGALLGGLG